MRALEHREPKDRIIIVVQKERYMAKLMVGVCQTVKLTTLHGGLVAGMSFAPVSFKALMS